MKTKLLILGAGPGGYVAAIRAARLGLQPVLVEKHKIGGVCLNYGCIPTKILLGKTAITANIKKGKRFGLSADNVNLDYAKLSAYKDRVVDGLVKGIETLLTYSGVKIIPETGKFVSENKLELSSADYIEFERALVAAGSRNRNLPGIEVDDKYILDSTSALVLGEIPQSLLVIGAGAIGLEIGLIFNRLGAKVTVVEVMSEILPGMDTEFAGMLRNSLTKEGMKFHLNSAVEKIDKRDNLIGAKISGVKDILFFNKVLLSAGRIPNSECLDGIEIEKIPGGYLKVDDKLDTSIAGIKAIGDVMGLPLLAHKASHQGIIAVELMAGIRKHGETLTIPGAVFTEPEFASVGLTLKQAEDKSLKATETLFPLSAVSRAKTMDAAVGGFKIVHQVSGKILGVHILAPDAGNMIAEASLALKQGLTVRDIAETIHIHPTLSEGMMEAALAAEGRGIHV